MQCGRRRRRRKCQRGWREEEEIRRMSSRRRRRHYQDSHDSFGKAVDQNSQSLKRDIYKRRCCLCLAPSTAGHMSARHTHQGARTSLEMRLSMRFLITCQPSCHTGESSGSSYLGIGFEQLHELLGDFHHQLLVCHRLPRLHHTDDGRLHSMFPDHKYLVGTNLVSRPTYPHQQSALSTTSHPAKPALT